MKILISIVVLFFVTILNYNTQASEIHRASDEEVIKYLNELKESWFGSYYYDDQNNNLKNGYMSEKYSITQNNKGKKQLHINSNINFIFISDGAEMKTTISSIEEYEISAPFNFIFTNFEVKDGDDLIEISQELNNGKLKYYQNVYGDKIEKESTNIEYTLNDYFALLSWINKDDLQINDSTFIKTLSEDTIALEEYIITNIEISIINGIAKKIIEIYSPETEFIIYSEDGKIVSGNFFWANIPIEFRLEPRNKAIDLDYIADLYVLNSISTNSDHHTHSEIFNVIESNNHKEIITTTYEIIGEYNDSINSIYTNQKIFEKDDAKYITLGKNIEYEFEKVNDTVISKTREFKINSLKLKDKQNKTLYDYVTPIIIDAKSEEEVVMMLAEWVYYNIKQVSEIEEVIDPLKILERGKGDCTEISDLFNAMLKVSGIPARSVTGYVGGPIIGGNFSFGGHQWSEVALDGIWIPLDVTWLQWLDDSLFHIKTNGNENEANLIKKFSLRLDSIYYNDTSQIYFNKDGSIIIN